MQRFCGLALPRTAQRGNATSCGDGVLPRHPGPRRGRDARAAQISPKQVHNTNFVAAIAILLGEATAALEEATSDLSDAQIAALPVPGRTCIAWIAVHAMQNLDAYARHFQVGRKSFPHVWRWDLCNCKPEERPMPGDPFPAHMDIMAPLRAVREGIASAIAETTEQDLCGKRKAEDWWKHNAADAYLRTICHTAAHVRVIWLLWRALGLTDGKMWSIQHWA